MCSCVVVVVDKSNDLKLACNVLAGHPASVAPLDRLVVVAVEQRHARARVQHSHAEVEIAQLLIVEFADRTRLTSSTTCTSNATVVVAVVELGRAVEEERLGVEQVVAGKPGDGHSGAHPGHERVEPSSVVVVRRRLRQVQATRVHKGQHGVLDESQPLATQHLVKGRRQPPTGTKIKSVLDTRDGRVEEALDAQLRGPEPVEARVHLLGTPVQLQLSCALSHGHSRVGELLDDGRRLAVEAAAVARGSGSRCAWRRRQVVVVVVVVVDRHDRRKDGRLDGEYELAQRRVHVAHLARVKGDAASTARARVHSRRRSLANREHICRSRLLAIDCRLEPLVGPELGHEPVERVVESLSVGPLEDDKRLLVALDHLVHTRLEALGKAEHVRLDTLLSARVNGRHHAHHVRHAGSLRVRVELAEPGARSQLAAYEPLVDVARGRGVSLRRARLFAHDIGPLAETGGEGVEERALLVLGGAGEYERTRLPVAQTAEVARRNGRLELAQQPAHARVAFVQSRLGTVVGGHRSSLGHVDESAPEVVEESEEAGGHARLLAGAERDDGTATLGHVVVVTSGRPLGRTGEEEDEARPPHRRLQLVQEPVDGAIVQHGRREARRRRLITAAAVRWKLLSSVPCCRPSRCCRCRCRCRTYYSHVGCFS